MTFSHYKPIQTTGSTALFNSKGFPMKKILISLLAFSSMSAFALDLNLKAGDRIKMFDLCSSNLFENVSCVASAAKKVIFRCGHDDLLAIINNKRVVITTLPNDPVGCTLLANSLNVFYAEEFEK
jgi:hypothetical protein